MLPPRAREARSERRALAEVALQLEQADLRVCLHQALGDGDRAVRAAVVDVDQLERFTGRERRPHGFGDALVQLFERGLFIHERDHERELRGCGRVHKQSKRKVPQAPRSGKDFRVLCRLGRA